MDDFFKAVRIDDAPTDKLTPLTIGRENIVLLRTDGKLLAFKDRCPHRFVPLSLGKFEDGMIHCPYHGLRFGTDGKCLFNPHGDGRIPDRARMTRYPVERRGDAIFICLDQGAGDSQ